MPDPNNTTLIDFNKKGPVTPLVAIYPSEGTFTHDNPFIVMSSASAGSACTQDDS